MNEELQQLFDLVQQLAKDVAIVRGRLERPVPGPVQEWFSIKEAALVVGLSTKYIRRAIVGATLPCSNVASNDRPLYRISKNDLDIFMAQRKTGALPAPKNGKKFALPDSPHYPRSRTAKMQTVRDEVASQKPFVPGS